MKKIDFFGDSITEGCGVNQDERFPTRLSLKLNCKEINHGIGGTRIARQTKPSENLDFDKDFISRVDGLDKDADLVIFLGGTNDFGHGDAVIGNDSDTSIYTFYGATKKLISLLLDKYPKNKMLFILPLPRLDQEKNYKGENSNLKVYKDILKSQYEKNNLDYISFDDLLDSDEKIIKYTVDGLHPNAIFHEMMAERLKDYIIKKKYLD